MATRTAPTVDGTASVIRVTYHLIDDSGDKRSFQLKGTSTNMTDTNIESLAAALQAATNASLWKVSISSEYEGAASAANADEDAYTSVYDNIVILHKATALDLAQNSYIPAPIVTLFSDSDNVNTSNAQYTAFRDAANAVLPSGYSALTVRFTERREINDSEPATA